MKVCHGIYVSLINVLSKKNILALVPIVVLTTPIPGIWHMDYLIQSLNFFFKLHFRKALLITFGMIYHLFGFTEVPIFPLSSVMTSL